MKRKRFSEEQIIAVLREPDAGAKAADLARKYGDEGLRVHKRRARRRAIGIRAPIVVEARVNARWSLDFVHDQMANGRRFRVLNIVDDVTRECLAAIPDTSPISGMRVAPSPRQAHAKRLHGSFNGRMRVNC